MQKEQNVRVSNWEKEYEALPDWKKKLWSREDFLTVQNKDNRIRQIKYDNTDWT